MNILYFPFRSHSLLRSSCSSWRAPARISGQASTNHTSSRHFRARLRTHHIHSTFSLYKHPYSTYNCVHRQNFYFGAFTMGASGIEDNRYLLISVRFSKGKITTTPVFRPRKMGATWVSANGRFKSRRFLHFVIASVFTTQRSHRVQSGSGTIKSHHGS